MSAFFSHALAAECRAALSASPERRQIAAALSSATLVDVRPSLVRSACLLLQAPPVATLRLSGLALPPLLWLELPARERTDAAAPPHLPDRTGLLVMRDPHDEDGLTILSAWREADGRLGFSAALARTGMGRLSALRPSGWEDLLGAVDIGMPSGLREDMRMWLATQPQAREGEMVRWSAWRTACDVPLALSLLALLGCAGVSLSDAEGEGDSPDAMVAEAAPEGGLLGWLARRAMRSGGIWFPRLGRPVWVPPPSS